MSVEQIRKRLQNQHAILLALHHNGAMQRSALSERLGIRKSSITSIVSDLLDRGVLREEVPGALRSPVSLDKEKFHVAAAFLEPGELHTADVRLDGSLINRSATPLPADARPDVLLDATAAALAKLTGDNPDGLLGTGVAIPGLVDPNTDTGLYAVNFPNWRNIQVGAHLRERLGLPVAVAHDGRCQLVGNTWFATTTPTSRRLPRNVLYLCLKEGVSCSVMVDGRVLLGNHAAAGEIGCLRAGSEGRLCSCGKRDCLQTYVSLPAITDALDRAHPNLGLTSAAAIAAAAPGNAAITDSLARVLEPLAEKISNLMALLDPEFLLVGTPDAAFSDVVVPLLGAKLDTELAGLYAKSADISAALPIVDSTLLGAAARIIDDTFASGTFSAGETAAA